MNYSDLIIYIFEMIGTVAFASSGRWSVSVKKYGHLWRKPTGITTAVGGGCIRDIILGITPRKCFNFQLCRGFHLISCIPVHHLLSESGTALKPLS